MTWGTKWYEESNDMRNQMVGGVKWYEGSNDMRIRGSNDYPGEKTVLPLRETILGVTVCSAVAVGRIPGGWVGSQQVNSYSGTRSALLFKIQVALVMFHIQVNGWGWWGEGGGCEGGGGGKRGGHGVEGFCTSASTVSGYFPPWPGFLSKTICSQMACKVKERYVWFILTRFPSHLII